MAKKKKAEAGIKKGVIQKDVEKEYGAGAWITGDQLTSGEILRVSPKIDLILGGGIPGGSVVTLAGDPKCGKTVTSLHILGKAQLLGRPTFFINVEGRLKPRDLAGISCLDPKKLNIVRSYRDKETGRVHIFKADQFLDITEKIIHQHPGAVVVIDSISQLVTGGEMDNEISDRDRAPGATLMAKFCRRLANVIPVNDTILVGILHFIANTSGFGKSKVASGGRKITYAMDVGLECKTFKFIREGEKKDDNTSRPIGQDVDWVTTSTAFGPPGLRATSRITYGIGIDELSEIIDLSTELGLIEQSASWFKLSFMEEHMEEDVEFDIKQYQIQGKQNLLDRLNENEVERECLCSDFREMVGIE